MKLLVCAFLLCASMFINYHSFMAIDGKIYHVILDDALISMRYAWNLSHGIGLVWNVGEYVQGYSNLLMVLLMAGVTLCCSKITSVLIIQIIGALTVLAIAVVCVKISEFFSKDKFWVAFLVLFYLPLVYLSLMGMETGLLTLLLCLAVLYALKEKPHVSFLFLGLAFLTRTDAALFLFPFLFYFGVKRSKSAIIWLMFVIAYFVFSKVYYGDFLANTFYLKMTGLSYWERIQNGVGFIYPFLLTSILWFVVCLTSPLTKRKVFLLSFIVILVGYQIFIGGDIWRFWRFLVPGIPLLIIVFLDNIKRHDRIIRTAFIIGSFALSNILSVGYFISGGETVKASKTQIEISILLDDILTKDGSVGVFYAGTIPYYSGRRSVDFLGKCDKHIAHLKADNSGVKSWAGMKSVPGHNKYDLFYSLSTFKPNYIEYVKWGNSNPMKYVNRNYFLIGYGRNIYSFHCFRLLKDNRYLKWKIKGLS